MEDDHDIFNGQWSNKRWINHGFIVRGNQGCIYRVTDKTGVLKGDYAYKRAIAPDEPERFLTEMRAMVRWPPNPHVAAAVDHSSLDGEDDGNNDWGGDMFIVMPYVHGKSLTTPENQALFVNNPLNTARFIGSMADALALVHAHDVVHRDIKPWNVILRSIDDAFLVDFGTSLLRVEYHDGVPVEIAPPSYCALDVYGLGKLVYYMLSGGKTVDVVFGIDQAFSDSIIKDDQSALLHRYLERMLCHPRSRMQTMVEVKAAMQDVINHSGFVQNT